MRFVPKHSSPDPRLIKLLAQLISTSRRPLVLTGAGVSTESGLPDYRSAEVGLYARTDRRPIEYHSFIRNEEARKVYWARNFIGWSYFSQVQPNLSHQVIAKWLKNNRISAIITQNVDRLHHRASRPLDTSTFADSQILELHGTSHMIICLQCGHTCERRDLQDRFLQSNPSLLNYDASHGGKIAAPDGDAELPPSLVREFVIPRCTHCSTGILKPDVVFFGENLPARRKEAAASLVDQSDLLLCMGSSLQAREREIPVCIINIGPTRADALAQLVLNSRISTSLDLIDQLIPI